MKAKRENYWFVKIYHKNKERDDPLLGEKANRQCWHKNTFLEI